MLPKSKLALDVFKAIEFLYLHEQAQQFLPQEPNIANTNPMQPLPGQGRDEQQQQVVGSSSGQPISSNGEPITVDVIIDRLNIIRGGKSFSEPEIYKQITELFNTLSEQDKVSLESFLTKMGEIVSRPNQNNTPQTINARTVQAPMNSQPAQNQQTNLTANAEQMSMQMPMQAPMPVVA
jgi:hypothetical protein